VDVILVVVAYYVVSKHVIVNRSDGQHVWQNDRNIWKMFICQMRIIYCSHQLVKSRTTHSW